MSEKQEHDALNFWRILQTTRPPGNQYPLMTITIKIVGDCKEGVIYQAETSEVYAIYQAPMYLGYPVNLDTTAILARNSGFKLLIDEVKLHG